MFVDIPLTQKKWQETMTSNLEVGEDRLTSDCIHAKRWVQRAFAPAFRRVSEWELAPYKPSDAHNPKENNDRAHR